MVLCSSIGAGVSLLIYRRDGKWFWRSVGGEAGVAVTLAVLVGVAWWYTHRPKPPKPWDNKSITAEFRNLNDDGGEIGFLYILTNHTDDDFRVDNKYELDLGFRADSSDVYNFQRSEAFCVSA
jgi:hypothetical protein